MYHTSHDQGIGGSSNATLSPHRASSHARTPGPNVGGSRMYPASRRKVPATIASKESVRHPVDGKSVAQSSPKQLFSQAQRGASHKMALQTPGRRAFGEKNVLHTPATGIRPQRNTPGAGFTTSSVNRKSDTEKLTGGIAKGKGNGASTSTPSAPRVDQSVVNATPAPSTARLSRKEAFVTPAANIGQAGLIRQRLADEFDALNGITHSPVPLQDESTQLTEEEMYPEIEYMPPSDWAKNPPYYFPDEMEDSPRAASIGEELRENYRCIGFVPRGESPQTGLSSENMKRLEDYNKEAIEVEAMQLRTLKASLDKDIPDPDYWPDVIVRQSTVSRASRPVAATSTARNTRAGIPADRVVVRTGPAKAVPASHLSATRRLPPAVPLQTRAPASSTRTALPKSATTRVYAPTASKAITSGETSSRIGMLRSDAPVVARARPNSTKPVAIPRSVVPSTGSSGPASRQVSVKAGTGGSSKIGSAPAVMRRPNPALQEFYKDSLGLLVEQQLQKLQAQLKEPEGFDLDDQ